MDLLQMLGAKHKDWCAMVRSFGCPDDLVEDFVQEMYLRMYKYVQTPDKIMYGDEINTFYVYVTLRNMYADYAKSKTKFRVINNGFPPEHAEMDYEPEEYELLLQDLTTEIWDEVDSWHWYDAKLFKIYMTTEMSMRDLSKETTISLRSIFNTLKNGKQRIKDTCQDTYEAWKATKEED